MTVGKLPRFLGFVSSFIKLGNVIILPHLPGVLGGLNEVIDYYQLFIDSYDAVKTKLFLQLK